MYPIKLIFITFVALMTFWLLMKIMENKTPSEKKTSKKAKEPDKLVSLMVLGEYKLNLTEMMNGAPKLKPQYLWDIEVHGGSTLSPVIAVSIIDTSNMMNKTEITTIEAHHDQWVPEDNSNYQLWYDTAREEKSSLNERYMNRMMEKWYAHIQKHIGRETPAEYHLAEYTEFGNFQF